jgi:hypothetical protein
MKTAANRRFSWKSAAETSRRSVHRWTQVSPDALETRATGAASRRGLRQIVGGTLGLTRTRGPLSQGPAAHTDLFRIDELDRVVEEIVVRWKGTEGLHRQFAGATGARVLEQDPEDVPDLCQRSLVSALLCVGLGGVSSPLAFEACSIRHGRAQARSSTRLRASWKTVQAKPAAYAPVPWSRISATRSRFHSGLA